MRIENIITKFFSSLSSLYSQIKKHFVKMNFCTRNSILLQKIIILIIFLQIILKLRKSTLKYFFFNFCPIFHQMLQSKTKVIKKYQFSI